MFSLVDINTPFCYLHTSLNAHMCMSSVLQQIIMSMITTNIIFYGFYNLYGSAKNICKYIFPT